MPTNKNKKRVFAPLLLESFIPRFAQGTRTREFQEPPYIFSSDTKVAEDMGRANIFYESKNAYQ